MHKVSFTQTVSIHCGRIALTEKQAKRRPVGHLKTVGEGLYEIKQTVQFKAGEAIGLDEVPKNYRHLLDPESEKMIARIEKDIVESVKPTADKNRKSKIENPKS